MDVREPFLFDAPGNGFSKLRVRIGRLPGKAWERLGEMDDVLSRAAGDLQHNASLGQNARKDLEYWALVAFRRWNGPFPISCPGAALLEHRTIP
jgi:hypothetical protein